MEHRSSIPWTKCDDRMPEKRGRYLCTDGSTVDILYYYSKARMWEDMTGYRATCSYWAPLPSTPQQAEDIPHSTPHTEHTTQCPAWLVHAVGHSTAEGTEYNVTIRASLAPGIYSSAQGALQSVLQRTNDRHFDARLVWDSIKVSICSDIETGDAEKWKTVGDVGQHRMGQVDPDSHETVPSFSDIQSPAPGLHERVCVSEVDGARCVVCEERERVNLTGRPFHLDGALWWKPDAPPPTVQYEHECLSPTLPEGVAPLEEFERQMKEKAEGERKDFLSEEAKGHIASKLADVMRGDQASWRSFPAELPPESGDYLVVVRNGTIRYVHYDAEDEVFGLTENRECYLVDLWLKVPPVPTLSWMGFCDEVMVSDHVDRRDGCSCEALPSTMGKHLRSQAPVFRPGLGYTPCGGVEKDEQGSGFCEKTCCGDKDPGTCEGDP